MSVESCQPHLLNLFHTVRTMLDLHYALHLQLAYIQNTTFVGLGIRLDVWCRTLSSKFYEHHNNTIGQNQNHMKQKLVVIKAFKSHPAHQFEEATLIGGRHWAPRNTYLCTWFRLQASTHLGFQPSITGTLHFQNLYFTVTQHTN